MELLGAADNTVNLVREKAVYGVVFILLFLLAAQCLLSMRAKSPTADEFSHHIANGYSYLLTGDFRMNPASPPLPRMLSALPLIFLNARAPLDDRAWQEGDSPEFARKFFYEYNHRLDDFIFLARTPIVILSLIFGLAVFLWAKELFGIPAGIMALILYSFCPDIVAHSQLATADLSIALFFFLSLITFRRYLNKPSVRNLVWTGAMVGLAFLSKFSAILILPILFLIAVFSKQMKKIPIAHFAGFFLVCFMTIWAGYFFELKPLLKNTPDPVKKERVYEKIGGPTLLRFAREIPVPLSTFSSAIVSMSVTRAHGTNAFLMGQWSGGGWWYYYFVAFLIKNTIPFVLLSVISILWIKKIGLDRVTMLFFLVPIGFFFLVTLPDKAQAGIRYFLPIYPLFFVLSAGTAAHFWKNSSKLRAIIVALLMWHAIEAARIYPNYLAYFNELIGGPKNGYKYLRDSNIDWGQDLKMLGELVKNKGYKEVTLSYPWPADPRYYKIPFRLAGPGEFLKPAPTIYAISVHGLDAFSWTKQEQPTYRVGYSIFVYDLRERVP